MPPRPARRFEGQVEPSLLPDDLETDTERDRAFVGVSSRMFLVSLGIGVFAATALSLASLLPR